MLSLHNGQPLHACWPHQVTRYQKWVPRLCVDASLSPVKVDQLDFFILYNHDDCLTLTVLLPVPRMNFYMETVYYL
jgi:hypothetical protein